MKNEETIKFKKNESFYIREGWFPKALNALVSNKEENIFSKNNGMTILGIGSNMVKGLKYWLEVSEIIESKNKTFVLTNFGKLINKYDPYFENEFTLYLIHYNLCKNLCECPIFYATFNSNINKFEKSDLIEFCYNFFKDNNIEVNKKYIEDDAGIFLNTYTTEGALINPEDNYCSPLTELNLIKRNNKTYEKKKPNYSKSLMLIICYILYSIYKKDGFKLEDSQEIENSPFKIFNLDRNIYYAYLEDARKADLLIINKTAGLNSIYFEKEITLDYIFKENFKEGNNHE